MRKLIASVLLAFCCVSAPLHAQYVDDEGSSPWFGGPGNYAYPMLCTECSVWQDYRNFAWNQLSINGGDAYTPVNPGNITSFRIYTHPTDDIYPATVEITQETIDIEIMGETIITKPANGDHYFVETHPENGDNVPVAKIPKDQGPLQFPYVPLPDGDDPDNGGGSGGGTSPGGNDGGGDSSSGGGGGGWGGGGGGAGAGGGGGGGWGGGGGYCGPGTEWHCVQL